MLLQKKLSFVILILIFHGCGPSQEEYNKNLAENESLKQEIETLKKEIDDLKYGADKLLSEAKSLFSSKDYQLSKSKLTELIDRHPASQESVEANKILEETNKIIEKERLMAEAEAKKKEAKAKAEAKKKEEEEKKRLARATSKMNKRYDDMNEITWYQDKSSGGYKSIMYAYIGKKENSSPWLRFYIRYYADNWLFIDNYKFKVDGETYTIKEKRYGEIKTDNSGGSIWETLDREANREVYNLLVAIANSKSAKIRHNGKDYYKDRTITSTEKRAIQNVLDAYEALGGKKIF